MGIEDALRRADLNLQAIREGAIRALDEAIDSIASYCAMQAGRPPLFVQDELHRLSNEIASLAGTFGLPSLGFAASSFCDLLRGCVAKGVWDSEAVALHLSALRLLRSDGGGEHAGLVGGLRQVVGRVLARAVDLHG